jgi:hypothetical protein
VNAIVPADELHAYALEKAQALASKAPEAFAAARRLMRGNKARLTLIWRRKGKRSDGRSEVERRGKHSPPSLRNVSRLSDWPSHGMQGSTGFKQIRNGCSRREKSSNSRRRVFAAEK